MKKLFFIFTLIIFISTGYSQKANDDLPVEFQNVAQQAFEKVSPATRQWFTETAKQHPPGNFDAVWAKRKIGEKFGVSGSNEFGELFVVMLAYQKMMNKEAREDRKLSRQDAKTELALKEAKIKKDNASIDQGMQESRDKADQAMTAAQTNMWIGIVSGVSTAGASTTNYAGNNRIVSNEQIRNTNVKIDSPKSKTVKTGDVIKKTDTEKGDGSKAGNDHRRALNDAVKKLLDQIAEMKRATNL